jgi:aminomethyltransferase
LTKTDLSGLRFFHCTDIELAGAQAMISRTGYTGDLGYEVFIKPQDAGKLWDSITENAESYKMRPTGLVALDMARIEAGLLQINAEFISASQTLFDVQKTSPFEVGLGWMVKLDGDLEKYFAEYGMPLHLPASAWTEAVPIYSDEAQEHHIGRGSSGMWSPMMKQYIAIARVDPKFAKIGSRFYIEEMIEAKAYSIPATVVKMPFFDPPRKKE